MTMIGRIATAACTLWALGALEVRAAAPVIVTYSFIGVCQDCSLTGGLGVASGTLVVNSAASILDDSNLISFDYTSEIFSASFSPFSYPNDPFVFSAEISPALPGPQNIVFYEFGGLSDLELVPNGLIFVSTTSSASPLGNGDWCIGDIGSVILPSTCASFVSNDFGNSHLFAVVPPVVGAVPEPGAALLLVGGIVTLVPVLGLSGRRSRRAAQ